jgi:hypothetical protein
MHAKQAEKVGELEMKVELKELAADGTSHAREPRRLSMGL